MPQDQTSTIRGGGPHGLVPVAFVFPGGVIRARVSAPDVGGRARQAVRLEQPGHAINPMGGEACRPATEVATPAWSGRDAWPGRVADAGLRQVKAAARRPGRVR